MSSAARVPLARATFERLWLEGRTHRAWRPDPVHETVLQQIYNVARWGATSFNCSPARFVFLVTAAARGRLEPALTPGNRGRGAPVMVLIAWDEEFYEASPRLWPHQELRPLLLSNPRLAEETAFRNSSLQGAYFMLAARAFGLDCGPMSGFDAELVNAEFFPEGRYKVNFICALGYGDESRLGERQPRLEFAEACRVL